MVKHVTGDIFTSGADYILHQVNCQGVMGSGVAKQVREKYPAVFEAYRNLCLAHTSGALNVLGYAQVVPNDNGSQCIVNLFAQEKFGYDGKCYTSYTALRQSLRTVREWVEHQPGATIAIPYLMSCHRGGGNWDTVLQIITEELGDLNVTLWEYNGG